MAKTDSTPAPSDNGTAAGDWDAQFAQLQARYPKVREPILVALHPLAQSPDIALEDAKAQAAVHGTRITAASVAAAQRLLSRQDGEPTPAAPKGTGAATSRRHCPTRKPAAPLDVEALIRETAAKIEAQGAAEAERLREAMRKAITVLEMAMRPGS